jgi:nicotinamide-nucleotide amidase
MRAELLFVGTELLLGEILNTNGQYLSQQLANLGIDLYYQSVVGDNWDRIAGSLQQALDRSDLVITSGGLGPTEDDITREVTAQVTGRPLALNAGLKEGLEAFYAKRKRAMPQNNLRQAMVPADATILHNDRGTAPGLIVPAEGGKAVVLLPGPPNELIPLFENQVIPFLTSRIGGQPLTLVSRTLRIVEFGESGLMERLAPLVDAQTDVTIAPYAKLAEVHLRLATKAESAEAGLAKIAPVEAQVRELVGNYVYGLDGTTLEAAVGELLRQHGLQLSLAESCTGGLIAQRITAVSGSSDYFGFGFTTYANEAKVQLLGVDPAVLAEHGAVSVQVAAQMAAGALRVSGADLALSVTGIAGPGGGSEAKPVGEVCFGLAATGKNGLPAGTWTKTVQFWGSRQDVRERAAHAALAWIRRYCLGRVGE